jgi:hypothetical protein
MAYDRRCKSRSNVPRSLCRYGVCGLFPFFSSGSFNGSYAHIPLRCAPRARVPYSFADASKRRKWRACRCNGVMHQGLMRSGQCFAQCSFGRGLRFLRFCVAFGKQREGCGCVRGFVRACRCMNAAAATHSLCPLTCLIASPMRCPRLCR